MSAPPPPQADLPDDVRLGSDPPSGDPVEAVCRLCDALSEFFNSGPASYAAGTVELLYRISDAKRVALGEAGGGR